VKVRLYFAITARDAHGRIVDRRPRRLCRSYVLPFIDALYQQGRGTGTTTIKDVGGTNRALGNDGNQFQFLTTGTTGNRGPVVGTSSTAVAIGDTALGAKIADGSGAGQLTHQAPTQTAPTTSGSSRSWTAQRVFVNNSGGTITIQECGFHWHTASWAFLMVRDLVAGGLAVPALGSATLTYTFSIAV
jgi:hypothetical protein